MTARGDRSELDALHALAARHGVATSYVDGTGVERTPSVDTIRAVLRALAVDPDETELTDLSGDTGDSASAEPVGRAPLPVPEPQLCAAGPQPARAWGVFSPLSALRRSDAPDHGLGDLTGLAELAAEVRRMGGSVVGTLPLVASRPDEPSPYSPLTRRFFDERWCDPAWVASRLNVPAPPARATVPSDRSEPEAAWRATRAALAQLVTPGAIPDEVVAWRFAHPDVETWARFKAAAARHGWSPTDWPASLDSAVRSHDDRALVGFGIDTHDVDLEVVFQWAVTAQLSDLADRERDAGAALYLDLPVGCDASSFDVWEAPHRFAAGMTVGAPPDAFFPDGQTWGLRPTNPRQASAEGHHYLRQCLEAHMAMCGLLRIDHVMGLHRLFWVPEDAPPGEGTYVTYPAAEQWAVVAELSQRYGVGVVGEDLGTVPAETREAMAAHGVRGLFIGQDEVRPPFRLSRPVPQATVASLNTHDLPPVAAWIESSPAFADAGDPAVVRDHLASELASSAADVVLLSDQDLVLDDRRFNVPGSVGGDIWRLRSRLTVDELRTGAGAGAGARRVATAVDRWRRTARGGWPEGVGPRLDDADIWSLHDGSHACLADRFGLHPRTVAGMVGCDAAVWAPHATAVAVAGEFDGWSGALLTARGDSGVWEGFVPAAVLGDRYKLHIRTADGRWLHKSDPFARASELPPGNASIITADDPAEFGWHDDEWMAARAELQAPGAPMSVYELHLGSWRHHADGRVPTYREVTPWLIEHMRRTGFTHVELMPILEHPFGGSWGYHVTGYFAPTMRYGTPAEFAWMIDELHRAGIGVILDWVPAHFPDDEHGLADFDGQALFEYADPREGRHPEWGSRVFDWGRNEVRAFLVSSARWWIERFHIDGLRVDAVASMLYRDYARDAGQWVPNRFGGRENLEAVALVRELTAEIHCSTPGAIVVAEESTSWPGVTHPTEHGGLGFDLKWDLGWMHDMLEYLGRDPIHRSWHQDDLTFRAMYAESERFILPLSHDEVVHGKGSLMGKMAGDDWQKRANLRLLFGHQFTVPGVPLVFMGGELAMNEEWNHDAALPWHLLDHAPHAGMFGWVSALNGLLRTQPALAAASGSGSFEWLDCDDRENSVLVWVRRTAAGDRPVVVAANFTPVPHDGYRIPLPDGGRWRQIANSDDAWWGGSAYPTPEFFDAEPVPAKFRAHSTLVTLPPLALIVLVPDPTTTPRTRGAQ